MNCATVCNVLCLKDVWEYNGKFTIIRNVPQRNFQRKHNFATESFPLPKRWNRHFNGEMKKDCTMRETSSKTKTLEELAMRDFRSADRTVEEERKVILKKADENCFGKFRGKISLHLYVLWESQDVLFISDVIYVHAHVKSEIAFALFIVGGWKLSRRAFFFGGLVDWAIARVYISHHCFEYLLKIIYCCLFESIFSIDLIRHPISFGAYPS